MAELGNAGPPPEGFTQEQWDNLCCCVCYGCESCEHGCHYTEEEQIENVRQSEEKFSSIDEPPFCEDCGLGGGWHRGGCEAKHG